MIKQGGKHQNKRNPGEKLEQPWKIKNWKKKRERGKTYRRIAMVVSDFIYPLPLRVHFFVGSLQLKSKLSDIQL